MFMKRASGDASTHGIATLLLVLVHIDMILKPSVNLLELNFHAFVFTFCCSSANLSTSMVPDAS
jgi:hypothetical protein